MYTSWNAVKAVCVEVLYAGRISSIAEKTRRKLREEMPNSVEAPLTGKTFWIVFI